MKITPDRQKYLSLAKSEGVHTALTQLHQEMNEIEYESFEGSAGYQPELYDSLAAFRKLSAEIWDLRIDPLGKQPQP